MHGDVTGTFSPASGTTSLAASAAYGPYGAVTAHSGTMPALGYQGQYTDPSTGATDMSARWYSPAMGAFTSSDSLGGMPDPSTSSPTPYGYASANPLTNEDPTGHYAVPGGGPGVWGSLLDAAASVVSAVDAPVILATLPIGFAIYSLTYQPNLDDLSGGYVGNLGNLNFSALGNLQGLYGENFSGLGRLNFSGLPDINWSALGNLNFDWGISGGWPGYGYSPGYGYLPGGGYYYLAGPPPPPPPPPQDCYAGPDPSCSPPGGAAIPALFAVHNGAPKHHHQSRGHCAWALDNSAQADRTAVAERTAHANNRGQPHA